MSSLSGEGEHAKRSSLSPAAPLGDLTQLFDDLLCPQPNVFHTAEHSVVALQRSPQTFSRRLCEFLSSVEEGPSRPPATHLALLYLKQMTQDQKFDKIQAHRILEAALHCKAFNGTREAHLTNEILLNVLRGCSCAVIATLEEFDQRLLQTMRVEAEETIEVIRGKIFINAISFALTEKIEHLVSTQGPLIEGWGRMLRARSAIKPLDISIVYSFVQLADVCLHIYEMCLPFQQGIVTSAQTHVEELTRRGGGHITTDILGGHERIASQQKTLSQLQQFFSNRSSTSLYTSMTYFRRDVCRELCAMECFALSIPTWSHSIVLDYLFGSLEPNKEEV